jgi:DNA-binding NtrC family response regulator
MDDTLKVDLFRTIGCSVRTPDIVGTLGHDALLFIFPETGDTARIPAERVSALVLKTAKKATFGLVLCPHHGMKADALIREALRAAKEAAPGSVHQPQAVVEHLSFGKEAPMVVAADEKMKRLFALIRNLAKSDLPILILGETGTGKEAAALAVHHWSKYQQGPFIAVNCAAVPSNLLESELFGHEKGAFTGADFAKVGLIESAHLGTLFLDEITEAPLDIQAKLLRVLETRRIRRIGATSERSVSIRIVAAANRSVEQMQEAFGFRKDLYFRIGGARIEIPPLRERPSDILPLARTFLQDAAERGGAPIKELSHGASNMLLSHSWPGNVRELKHAMTFVAAVTEKRVIEPADLLYALPDLSHGSKDGQLGEAPKADALKAALKDSSRFQKLSDEIRELEKRRMTEALIATFGVKVHAAALLGMPLRTFVGKVQSYGLQEVGRPVFQENKQHPE